jgi:huntingtin
MASVQQTIKAINDACEAKGGVYSEYSCKTVSWDDVSRGTVGGSLSCWGANITDTRLWAKDGRQLFTVRSNNWNEKLGAVSTSDVALVVGNDTPGGVGDLHPVTLRDVLANIGKYGGYAGVPAGTDLSNMDLDRKVSIRFQTTFLPVGEEDLASLEFCSEAYNYNTMSDSDPRNLVLLCTSQGLAVQQDGRGAKQLFHHAVDKSGTVHRYWLEAERSRHKVGGPQVETQEERLEAAARGKATSSVIGVRAMGTRFNVLMNIQVPLEQAPRPTRGYAELSMAMMPMMAKMAKPATECKSMAMMPMMAKMAKSAPEVQCRKSSAGRPVPKVGAACAARVSRGKEFDTWDGLTVKAPKRGPAEHVTVTVVIYNAVAGGVPSAADVIAAIDDLEQLYAACTANARLANVEFDFMKKELTVNDAKVIADKITTQPYKPSVQTVNGFNAFPL